MELTCHRVSVLIACMRTKSYRQGSPGHRSLWVVAALTLLSYAAMAAPPTVPPSGAEDEFSAGLADLGQGDVFNAFVRLRELNANDPEASKPYFYLAVLYSRLRQSDLAIQQIERALAIEPEKTAYWNLKGILLAEAGQLRPAVEALKKALEDPGIRDAQKVWRNLGDIHLRLSAHDQAEAALRQALAIEPRDPRTLYALGKIALLQGEVEAARSISPPPLPWPRSGRVLRLSLARH